jgi:hypothetical protein
MKLTMSGPTRPDKSGGVAPGVAGLVLTIIMCFGIAASPESLVAALFGCVLGMAGLVFSLIGIAKRSGRKSGVAGIVVFVLGSVMACAMILDFIAQAQRRAAPH